jgi:FtsH-binding integral membrane protein
MTSLFNRQASFNLNALTDFSHLPQASLDHLKAVYKNLTLLLFMSAVGAYSHMYVFRINSTLSLLGAIGCLLYLYLFAPYKHEKHETQTNRFVAFLAFGFLEGAALGDFVAAILRFDPNILLMAFVGTTAIFLSFTLASLLSNRREYLFLGGLLMSAINIMMWLNLLNLFIRSSTIPWIQLYGGLMVFCGYVIYDTQLIVEKATHPEHRDAIGNSIDLFIDFIGIFVRIVIILTNNKDKKKKRDE